MRELIEQAYSGTMLPPLWSSERFDVSIKSATRQQNTTQENNPIDRVYLTRRDGKLLHVHTTGNNLYEAVSVNVVEKKEQYQLKTPSGRGIMCTWCRQPIVCDYIPAIITACTATFFEGYDPCCSAVCAQAQLSLESIINPTDTTLKRAQDYLNQFCDVTGILKTNEYLHSAPDWRYHHANGGSLSDKQFYGETTRYVRQLGVYVVPVKLSYIESNSNNVF